MVNALKNLRAGDTVERTITITAAMTQAMLIPPLPFAAPDGIRVYPEEPSVQDQKTERGVFVSGRRMQSAKYFIQKAGDYTLPAIELKWWNLSTKRMETAILPAVHFTAAANTTYVGELPPEPEAATVVQQKHVSLWTRYKGWGRNRNSELYRPASSFLDRLAIYSPPVSSCARVARNPKAF
jgi:hypothetical protein